MQREDRDFEGEAPELRTIEAFSVAGLSVHTTTADELSPSHSRIPGLWASVFKEIISAPGNGLRAREPLFGVYGQYESDALGAYTVTAGVRVSDLASVLEGRSVATVEPGLYLVFTARGPVPDIVLQVWNRAWSFFQKDESFERTYRTDFERYPRNDMVELHVGVKRK